MTEHPAGDARPRLARRGFACLLSATCAVLSACGGADDGSAVHATSPSTAAPVPRQVPLLGHAMLGQTTVVLNPPAAPAAPASASTAPADPASPDPAATVAVSRDADGTVRLRQRDGTVREVAPDGKLVVRSGAAAAAPGDLPPTMIVAVDGANTVHIVDPDACMARTIARDGRVTTTLLPGAGAGGACATGRQQAR